MNNYLHQNLPTQPSNCRFLRKNSQRPSLLSGHLTLSKTPDCGKIKHLGQKKSKRWCFVLKKTLYLFYWLFLWLLGWKQTSEELRWTSIHLRYYAYQQTQWWSRCSNQNLQSKVIPTWNSWELNGLVINLSWTFFSTFHAGKHNSFPWLSTTLGYFMLLANLGFFSETLTKISSQLNPI